MTDAEINRITFEQWGPVIDVHPAAHRAYARAIIAAYQAKLRQGVEMPEEVAYLFVNVQSGYIEASTDPDEKQGESEMWSRKWLFTADQLQQYAAACAAQARMKALEDAKRVCVDLAIEYEDEEISVVWVKEAIDRLKGGE